MMDKLKPCPFCGSSSWNMDERGYAWFFHKTGCLFVMPIGDAFGGMIETDAMNKKQQQAWNRRADSGKGE
jgi:hypothetical protein